MCNIIAEVGGKDQDWSVVDVFVGLNQCKILLDSGAQTSVVAADLVPGCCYLNIHIQASGVEGILRFYPLARIRVKTSYLVFI